MYYKNIMQSKQANYTYGIYIPWDNMLCRQEQ